MQKINFNESHIRKVIIHTVGNRLKNDEYLLSDQELILGDPEMDNYFLTTTSKLVKNKEFFTFNNIESNSIYENIQSMINGKKFVENSHEICKHLFESIDDPKVKGGNVVFVEYKDVIVDNVLTNAIGIFKLKEPEKRITIHPNYTRYEVGFSTSFDLTKIDKGVMIYNYDSENGYLVSVLDKPTKSDVMQYWSKFFLDIVPRKDTVYFTNNALDIIENYVLEKLPELTDVKKVEQINLFNNSINYCQENDNFDYNDFSNKVFSDTSEEFLKYRDAYEKENDLIKKDDFHIDNSAVKKRAKKFKTIIKLDDNFDIIVKKGADNMIVNETDKQGRKYYKLFYNLEE